MFSFRLVLFHFLFVDIRRFLVLCSVGIDFWCVFFYFIVIHFDSVSFRYVFYRFFFLPSLLLLLRRFYFSGAPVEWRPRSILFLVFFCRSVNWTAVLGSCSLVRLSLSFFLSFFLKYFNIKKPSLVLLH